METLKGFVNTFFTGTMKPYIRSQPVPESNDGPVSVVVGETFNDCHG